MLITNAAGQRLVLVIGGSTIGTYGFTGDFEMVEKKWQTKGSEEICLCNVKLPEKDSREYSFLRVFIVISGWILPFVIGLFATHSSRDLLSYAEKYPSEISYYCISSSPWLFPTVLTYSLAEGK